MGLNSFIRPKWDKVPGSYANSINQIFVYFYLLAAHALGIWYNRVSRKHINRYAKQQVTGERSLIESKRSLEECQQLLESVFPKAVFKELQNEHEKGESLTACERFDKCTFLFAKIVGLNKLTAQESGVPRVEI